MYKIEFTLKQHTPLIHFQHDQAGATLRATEVKPKLDRFIIEKMGGKQNIPKEWFIDVDKDALDFKLSFFTDGIPDYYLPLALNPKSKPNPQRDTELVNEIDAQLKISCTIIAPSPFFANADKYKFQRNSDKIDKENSNLSELRFAVINNSPIKVTLHSKYKELIDFIDSYKELFFFLQNFGTRQSKGFGCFSISGNHDFSNLIQKEDLRPLQIEAIYSKTFETSNIQNVFNNINEMWKILKAGNSFGAYQKSDIFNYYYHLNPKVRWEKRAIKKSLKNNYPTVFNELKPQTSINRILTESDTQDDHLYIRALLGLAEQFEYGTKDTRNKVKIDVKETNDNIDRFQSPIIFKVVENRIYLICYQINRLLQQNENGTNRSFSFTLKSTVNKTNYSGNLANLEIPRNFSIANFLDSDKYDTATGRPKKDSRGKNLSIAKSFGYERVK